MTASRSWWLGMALLALFSWSSGAATQPRSSRRVRCSSIRVSSADTQPRRAARRPGRRAPAFSATDVLDLRFEVRVPRGLEDNEKIVFALFTPDGELYQELSVPVSAGERPSGPRGSRRRRRRYTVSGVLPVGGTAIVTSSLYGTWSVEARVDDADAPCTAPTRFVLQP